MVHAQTLMAGMRIEIGYTSRKRLDNQSYSDEFSVQAVGYDWLVLRQNNKPFAVTFSSHQESTNFMSEVTLL
jgi:hypothetical protein